MLLKLNNSSEERRREYSNSIDILGLWPSWNQIIELYLCEKRKGRIKHIRHLDVGKYECFQFRTVIRTSASSFR